MQRVRITGEPWGTRIELCAPEVRNALDPPTVASMTEALANDAPGAVLLCAQGPVFCAGGDVGVLAEAAAGGSLADVLGDGASRFAALIQAIVASPRPVVAALGGPAVGGGASLALAADVRLATPAARLSLAWGRWGLPPDGGATALLAAAVGPATARALLVEGADIGTDHPLAPLLFQHVVAPDELDAAAEALAVRLAESAGAAAAKAVTVGLILPALQAQCATEVDALVAAAGETAVADRLSLLYKMKK